MKKTQRKPKAEETGLRRESEASEKPIALLKKDHLNVKELFERFEKAEEDDEKEEIVREALLELTIHATVEEEIFYPEAREELSGDEDDAELMEEAAEEHYVAKLLISELEGMHPGDERFDAKFTVLAENVKHHIKEEEGEMFPKLKTSEANSEEVGRRMLERKRQLKNELNVEKEED